MNPLVPLGSLAVTLSVASAGTVAVTLLGIACFLLIGWAIFTFNLLIRRKILMQEAWSGIDVQLRRRRNLIPNLVEAVKGYRDYEKATLQRITELRIEGLAGDIQNRQDSENALTDQFNRFRQQDHPGNPRGGGRAHRRSARRDCDRR